MSKPAFSVAVADLELGPKALTSPIPELWLRTVLADTDAVPEGDGELDVVLSKSGRDVLVRGRARVRVTMPCVVTLDSLSFELSPEVSLLLSPEPTLRAKSGVRAPRAKGDLRAAGASRPGWVDDPELGSEEVAKDSFDGEKVVLDEFLREFILLELPLYPRRSDLPSDDSVAIAPPSPAADRPAAVDPRLLPLAAIASRLREQKKE